MKLKATVETIEYLRRNLKVKVDTVLQGGVSKSPQTIQTTVTLYFGDTDETIDESVSCVDIPVSS